MLRNIDPVLGPELLKILRSMGHGDEIAIVDANYPAASSNSNLVRLEGVSATRTLQAVVSVLPLDSYVDCPVHTMEVVGAPDEVPPIVAEFRQIINDIPGNKVSCSTLERFAFYEQTKTAFAIVVTGEQRIYGNIILKKGVIAS